MNTANHPISAPHLEWLENRAIDSEHAVVAMRLYSAKPAKHGGDPVPDVGGNILVFPYFDGGVEINAKYRGPGKKFWQRTGARKTFYNADVMDDPALAAGTVALVITEGELDAVVAIQCGYPHSVSCPDGAPADRDAQGRPIPMRPDRELDPPNDSKFEYVFNNYARLGAVKRIILATDGDGPGVRLRDELARRIGRARCLFVEYPTDHLVDDEDRKGKKIKRAPKDLNEVRQFFGDDAVREVIRTAKPYPVKGLYQLSQYPELPPIPTFATGWWTLDRHLKLFAGEFMVVTGIPSHGKSTWVLNLVVNLAEKHGWRSAIFSPEMPTVPHMRDKLRRIKLRKRPLDLEWERTVEADQWINDNLVFIDADPGGRDDEDFDLEWIILRATDAVMRHGVRVLVIDPWNEIDHARLRGESETDYIGRSIRSLKRFGQQYGVAVIVIAHPSKEVAKDGKARSPTLYDITGSAHFFNKCDHGIIVDRPDPSLDESTIRIAKVRFDETGDKGQVRMKFDRESSRFEILDGSTSDPLGGETL